MPIPIQKKVTRKNATLKSVENIESKELIQNMLRTELLHIEEIYDGNILLFPPEVASRIYRLPKSLKTLGFERLSLILGLGSPRMAKYLLILGRDRVKLHSFIVELLYELDKLVKDRKKAKKANAQKSSLIRVQAKFNKFAGYFFKVENLYEIKKLDWASENQFNIFMLLFLKAQSLITREIEKYERMGGLRRGPSGLQSEVLRKVDEVSIRYFERELLGINQRQAFVIGLSNLEVISRMGNYEPGSIKKGHFESTIRRQERKRQ